MLIPKVNRRKIYEYLFKEGVVIALNDLQRGRHSEDLDVPNLHVVKLMQSFKSRGYVKETYAWRHHYYYLTNEGIDYLREQLGLPSDVIPQTLVEREQPSLPRFGGRRREGDFGRGGYRRGGGAPRGRGRGRPMGDAPRE
uniref:40S ribosomal protein S10-1 n=1 Tax=Stygiella incarcerata TaxID=1712417 RepID=A0A192ZIS0_9EUKA|nr:40S ribosomal protein S10-1 [Stygiella incarcerata]|eukprot:TRINITY_DN84_c0_g1_i1.p1 TRINITY_DN84_c0_g1~~TRINITY_DN84_c0_g1_i1.p1  ORF type:complete len:140 (-),score=35.75 TRINITY_DN84_c0_g1_i1:86-505(-)